MVMCVVCGNGVGGSGYVVCGHCRRKQEWVEKVRWCCNVL